MRLQARFLALGTAAALLTGTVCVPAAGSEESVAATAGVSVALSQFEEYSETPNQDIYTYLFGKAEEKSGEGALSDGSAEQSPASLSPFTGLVSTSGSLNVRTAPSPSAEILATLESGMEPTVFGSVTNETGTWYQITLGNLQGYVPAVNILSGQASYVYHMDLSDTKAVIIQASELLDSASASANVIGSVSLWERYPVTDIQNGYARLTDDNGNGLGFVSLDAIRFSQSLSSTDGADETAVDSLSQLQQSINDKKLLYLKQMSKSLYQDAASTAEDMTQLWSSYAECASEASLTELAAEAVSQSGNTQILADDALALQNGSVQVVSLAQPSVNQEPQSESSAEPEVPTVLPAVPETAAQIVVPETTIAVTETFAPTTVQPTVDETFPTVTESWASLPEETTAAEITLPSVSEQTTAVPVENVTVTVIPVETAAIIESTDSAQTVVPVETVPPTEPETTALPFQEPTTETVTTAVETTTVYETETVQPTEIVITTEEPIFPVIEPATEFVPVTEPETSSTEIVIPQETETAPPVETVPVTETEPETIPQTTVAEDDRTTAEPETAPVETEAPAPTLPPSLATTAELTTPISALRQSVISYALSWVGRCNYVWAGTNLVEGGGVDCSGFTMQVYATAGVSLPHYSMSQMYCGTAVDYSQMLPGDLVVYNGHVAIYIGNGQIVHAKSAQTGIVTDPVYFKLDMAPVAFVRLIND